MPQGEATAQSTVDVFLGLQKCRKAAGRPRAVLATAVTVSGRKKRPTLSTRRSRTWPALSRRIRASSSFC